MFNIFVHKLIQYFSFIKYNLNTLGSGVTVRAHEGAGFPGAWAWVTTPEFIFLECFFRVFSFLKDFFGSILRNFLDPS